jgi:hypothetical protein
MSQYLADCELLTLAHAVVLLDFGSLFCACATLCVYCRARNARLFTLTPKDANICLEALHILYKFVSVVIDTIKLFDQSDFGLSSDDYQMICCGLL